MAKFDTTNASKPKYYPIILLESLQFSIFRQGKDFVYGFCVYFSVTPNRRSLRIKPQYNILTDLH